MIWTTADFVSHSMKLFDFFAHFFYSFFCFKCQADGDAHIQRFQAVPAEGVLAALAHHLRTALVPLDVHLTPGAALDRGVLILNLTQGAEGRQAKGCKGLI